jgi:hypothetical protein
MQQFEQDEGFVRCKRYSHFFWHDRRLLRSLALLERASRPATRHLDQAAASILEPEVPAGGIELRWGEFAV